jgi:hypothetical protein
LVSDELGEVHTLELFNCNIVDVESGRATNGGSLVVVVEGARIKEVRDNGGGGGGSGRNSSPGPGAIDMQGCFVLPGLFNCHSHLSLPFSHAARNPQETEASVALRCFKRATDALLAGVTTIRTVGEVYRCDLALRDAVNSKTRAQNRCGRAGDKDLLRAQRTDGHCGSGRRERGLPAGRQGGDSPRKSTHQDFLDGGPRG